MPTVKELLRPRLLRALRTALGLGHVSIVAPGGYGKSILLHSLARQRPDTHYFALTRTDTDPARLRERLAHLSARPEATILLDDVHALADAPDALVWLAERLASPAPRYVLSGREQVLAHLDVPLTHFSAADLAFTQSETEAYVGHRAWQRLTGGWPLALTLLDQLPSERWTASPDEGREVLFERLIRALLDELPPDLVDFMRVTAAPLHFTIPLADHLVSGDTRPFVDEIRRRRLFVEDADGEAGRFRYHDLVRGYLAGDLDPMRRVRLLQAAVAWFEAADDVEMAIEHSLEGSFYDRAAGLLEVLPDRFLRDENRYMTYRRWVMALPQAWRARQPVLLVRLATHLFTAPGYREEAWQWIRDAVAYARESGDAAVERQARNRIAMFYYRGGDYRAALRELDALLADPAHTGRDRLYSQRISAIVLAETADFRAARRRYDEVLAANRAAGDVEEEIFNRQNLAITVLAPLGEYVEAEQHMAAALAHYADSPGLRIRCLHMLCDLHVYRGDWDALARTLDEIETTKQEIEVVETGEDLWPAFYRACVAIGQGRLTEGRAEAAYFRDHIEGDYPMARISYVWLECWLLRREGRHADAVHVADENLARPFDLKCWRAALALQAGAAQAEGRLASFALPPEARDFVAWRARAELVLLRGLLAVACWQQGVPRWSRHAALERFTGDEFQLFDSQGGLRYTAHSQIAGQWVGQLQPPVNSAAVCDDGAVGVEGVAACRAGASGRGSARRLGSKAARTSQVTHGGGQRTETVIQALDLAVSKAQGVEVRAEAKPCHLARITGKTSCKMCRKSSAGDARNRSARAC